MSNNKTHDNSCVDGLVVVNSKQAPLFSLKAFRGALDRSPVGPLAAHGPPVGPEIFLQRPIPS